ncbi:biotin transporter BioY [Synechococcus sp. Nb3U1]|uniref:biotin transporter BioY n=1 Tax=Synechococcus sp. Nb3U1 TaxID=1914529 RepID=UPI001F3C18D3|nr:biotin transporter BioY [Synechococcus sp. Nb3U1]MCF2971007.1 biotin transporter BioY [Synechococcus sp. Nb3U1]
MTTAASVYTPLVQTLIPRPSRVRDALLILGGSLFVAVLAQVRIPLPFTPVPITGQTFAVLLVGAGFGARLGFLTLLLYLLEGILGLPVFTGSGSGLSHLAGPTGGYLLAFPLAAGLMGWLVQQLGVDRHAGKMAVAMLACTVLIYLIGATWLGVWLNQNVGPTSLMEVLQKGVFPFWVGDLIKMGLTALLLPVTWRWLGREKSTPEQD